MVAHALLMATGKTRYGTQLLRVPALQADFGKVESGPESGSVNVTIGPSSRAGSPSEPGRSVGSRATKEAPG